VTRLFIASPSLAFRSFNGFVRIIFPWLAERERGVERG